MGTAYCSARAVSCGVVRARIRAQGRASSQLLAIPTKFLTGGLRTVVCTFRQARVSHRGIQLDLPDTDSAANQLSAPQSAESPRHLSVVFGPWCPSRSAIWWRYRGRASRARDWGARTPEVRDTSLKAISVKGRHQFAVTDLVLR